MSIHWTDAGKKGQCDRYEVMIVPMTTGEWSALIWVRKTLVDRIDKCATVSVAQERAEDRIERLHKDAKRLEGRLYEWEEEAAE